MWSAAYGLMALAVVASVVLYAAVRGVCRLRIPRLCGYTASSLSWWSAAPTYGD
jgi:hypothetical protein